MTAEEFRALQEHFKEESRRKAEQRKAAVAKAAQTRAYKLAKPKAILELEAAFVKKFGKSPTWDDRTANGLTEFLLDYLNFHGYYGARINTGGVPIGATGAGGREVIKWATSGSTKGVADVIACIDGRFCQFEVKAGKDRPRADQLQQASLTRDAGGFYEFIHSADEFVESVKNIQKK